MFYFLIFLLGAIVGSFLNVCIHRIPRDQSIVWPGSHCPHCQQPIPPYDNIPLLSFFLLGGRCRSCRETIDKRYPIVEFLCGGLALLLYRTFPEVPLLFLYSMFVAALVVVSFIDIDFQIIPDVISLPGIVVGLAASLAGVGVPWIDSVIGVLVGGGLLYLVAFAYEVITGRVGMGGGDIKLLAMIGAFLGWQAVLLTVMIASLTGALYGVTGILLRSGDRQAAIPFGPFLSLGAVVALLYGSQLISWYIGYLVGNL